MDFAPQLLLDKDALAGRLLELWERTGDEGLRRLAEGKAPHDDAPMSEADRLDWVSTVLMDCYRNTSDSAVFTLLVEVNTDSFLHAIQSKLRRTVSHVDPQDVLQEVFLNIYRYPHKFLAERADSFRNWGHRIVRNTLLKSLKGESRSLRWISIDEDTVEREDTHERAPDRSAAEAESALLVDRAYLIYLSLYLLHYERLSAKEKKALTMVEVEGASYRAAADALGIRLENLKMVIFRGRRKIFRGLTRTLSELDSAPDATHADLGATFVSTPPGTSPVHANPAPPTLRDDAAAADDSLE
ncbi:MAG: RNA polymerase sigma factor [Planctomycetes bacterium]|nr:RNA polymerase sigma factor [Planctomycetota bacterium]